MKKLLCVLFFAIFIAVCPGQILAQDGSKTYNDMILSAPIPATETPSEKHGFFSNPHVMLSDTIASRYWGSIVGGIFYSGGPVNFTDFKFTVNDPVGTSFIFVGMINPLDTLKYDYNGGTEYYAGVGKTFDIAKGGPNNLPLIRLTTICMFDSIHEIERIDDDVIQQYLRIDLPRIPVIQPYAEGYNWIKSGDRSPPVGYFARAGIHRQQPLGFSLRKSPMELGLDLSVGYSGPGLFGTSEGLAYYRAVVSTAFQISKNFKIVPAIIGQLPGGGQDKSAAFVDRPRLFYNLTLQWDH